MLCDGLDRWEGGGVGTERERIYVWFSRSVMSYTLRPIDCSPSGASVHGIPPARILVWAALSLSRGSSHPRICVYIQLIHGLPWWLSSQESACNAGDAGDAGSIPGSGRSPGGGHGNPLQYSCLENPMGRGSWRAAVHRALETWT